MRKIWLLVFSFLIFLLSFNVSLAVTLDTQEENAVNYELPYPGLLPDSPLYFLRVTRDKLIGFLISDPLKKAEFNLLQADKRLNAGIYVFDKRKIPLAISTISKAENYFSEALDRLGDAEMQGRSINEMKEKLKNSLKKHKQELEYLAQKSSANFAASFNAELKRITNFEERLSH